MKVTAGFIEKYNVSGPRYTSYPPANFFSDTYTPENYIKDLKRSNKQEPRNISLYIHIPFCKQICNFCGCFSEKIRDKEQTDRYMQALIAEAGMISGSLDKDRYVSQIHWGGGTPNAIPLSDIEKTMNFFRKNFRFTDNCETAIECNPAWLDHEDIRKLALTGFNRISLGIQDLNTQVLEAVNRKPSKIPVNELVDTIRKAGFLSCNIDLIYGLPGQNTNNFLETIKKIISLSPDRLVTFSYAHVPWIKKHQHDISIEELPSPGEKLTMFIRSFEMLNNNGYVSIGLDHYAKPGDELAIALKNKTLHRNFQGYCTRETTGQVYALGASGISQLYDAYAQNTKNIQKYIKEIMAGRLATERGYSLSEEEIIVRTVITELMCNCRLDMNSIADQFHITVDKLKSILQFSDERISVFREDKLLEYQNNIISVNEKGRLVIRNIAMAFDPALATGDQVYSKTV